jgi:hypothetical protein
MNAKIIRKLLNLSTSLQKASDDAIAYERNNYPEMVKELDTTLANAVVEAHSIMGLIKPMSRTADALNKLIRNCCAVRNVYTGDKRTKIEELEDDRFNALKEHMRSWIGYYAEDLKRETYKINDNKEFNDGYRN